MAWSTKGVVTDPVAGDVLADTGAIGPGAVTCTVVAYIQANTASVFDMQHRDATNATTLYSQKIYIPYGAPSGAYTFPVVFGLNEHLRIVLDIDVIGDVQASILTSL